MPASPGTDPSSAASPVRVEVTDGVGRITLWRPERRNALSLSLRRGLIGAIEQLAADVEVRVIVVTGTGTVFCAGADLGESDAERQAAPSMTSILQGLMEAPKPVVCVLNGIARAGGIGLVAASDIAIAPDDATFAFTEVRLGLVPAMISVPCLERMSRRQTIRYFLTGETFGAREALDVGLVTMVAPAEGLQARADALIQALLLGAPAALAATKRLLDEVPGLSRGEAFAVTADVTARFFASDDGREGRAAFAEKRQPRWVPPVRGSRRP